MSNQIFFSYSRADSAFAIKLANDLKTHKVEIWMDQLNILPAQRWDAEIQSALIDAKCILFLVSANSVKSNNVLDEVNYVIDNNKKLIPVLLDNSPLPYRVNRFQWVNFVNDYDGGLQKLLAALNTVNPDPVHETPRPVPGKIQEREGLLNTLLRPGFISKAAGILFILFAALITIINKCPSNGQVLTIYSLLGIGLALLFAQNAEKTILKFSLYNVTVALAGGLALPFILFLVDPINHFSHDDCSFNAGLTSITISVHGKKGIHDMVLKGKGKVLMDVPGEIKKQSINENGQAFFPNVHIGDKVKLGIDFSEPYNPVFPDSTYTIKPNDNIYLQVSLEGIGKVYGKVLFQDSVLQGVKVQIDTLNVITDETGSYTIIIPENLQKSQYDVWFSKPGFKAKKTTAYPQVGQPLDIVLEK